MPFIPHTKPDVTAMLNIIGVNSVDNLFDEIPASLRVKTLTGLPAGMTERELARLAGERAAQDGQMLCFIGAGAYEHYVPAAVWEIATRGEFLTAYTPYQAEASQGSLQVIYEFQTMIANLMAMDISNASLYDGASALAEAVLMAVRYRNKKGPASILIPKTVHPHYRASIMTIASQQAISLIEVPYHKTTGCMDLAALEALYDENVVALVVPQPNFLGILENTDELCDWASHKNLLTIGLVNPLAMALLKPPGKWGKQGADIACGEGQPLGIPLSGGGPYFGFLTCKKTLVRQMPGRLVGRTLDLEGKQGFVLTLQAREQHIRRAKATSNICTNQGLMVTASTIYMSLMGPLGLRHVAAQSHQKMKYLLEMLLTVKGVVAQFSSPFLNEVVVRLPISPEFVLHELANHGIQGGFALKNDYTELENCLLVCATETKTNEDIKRFVQCLSQLLHGRELACLG